MTEAIVVASTRIKEVRATLARPEMMHELCRAVGSDSRVERMLALGLNAVKQNLAIARDCETRSIIGAIIEATQLNLELDKHIGQAYLVPLRDKHRGNRHFCNMWIGYKGFIKLTTNTTVRRVNCEIVREADEFDIKLGTNRELTHNPDLKAKGREDQKTWIGAYSTVLHASGVWDFHFMTREEILAVKASAPGKNANAWTNFEGEMWKKTPLRRQLKRVPQSPENLNLVHAAIVDESRQLGLGGRHKVEGMPTPAVFEEFLPDESEPIDVEAREPEKEVQRKSARADAAPAGRTDAAAKNGGVASGDRIDAARISAISGLVKKHKMTNEEIESLLKQHGVDQASDLTMAKFGDFWAALTKWKRGAK